MMQDNGRKRIILVIDDNMTNLKAAMLYLEAYSFDIFTARDGLKGIKRAQLANPDLILLDINMPGIDGFETCRRLKANPQTKRIPIIFITAASETTDKVQGLELGAVDYITKPFDAAELLARVRTHITLYDLQEHLELLVADRTSALEAEIEQRQQQQEEKEQLWQTIYQQNEQFQNLTRIFLEQQNQSQLNVTETLHQSFTQNLQILGKLVKQSQQATDEIKALLLRQRLTHYLTQIDGIAIQLQQQTDGMTASLDKVSAEHNALIQNPLLQLSNREREVMHLLINGKTTREAAQLLNVAPGTISTYRGRIMEKLGVSDFASLVRLVNEYTL